MRSNQNHNNTLGSKNGKSVATAVVRLNAYRLSPIAILGALFGMLAPLASRLRDELRHWPTVTRCITRVTGGACDATTSQRSGQHHAMCCLAAS